MLNALATREIRAALLYVLCSLLLPAVSAFRCLHLRNTWTLSNSNGSISLQTQVPGYALQTLHEQGLIDDPLSGYNEVKLRWVAEETWRFSTSFVADKDLLACAVVKIDVMGVDTAAQVVINGQAVEETANAFREHQLPVKQFIHPGTNTIQITIYPAPQAAQKRYDAYPYDVPTMYLPTMIPHYNFLRKAPADFGWDWGPAFAPAGVYGGVMLVGYDSVYISGANVRQQHGDRLVLFFDVQLQWSKAGQTAILCICAPDNRPWSMRHAVVAPSPGQHVHTVQVHITEPYDLWWPVGYSTQSLYTFTISISPETSCTQAAACTDSTRHTSSSSSSSSSISIISRSDSSSSSSSSNSSSNCTSSEMSDSNNDYARYGSEHALVMTRRVGLRKVEVVRDQLEDGETFFFRVNGVPIYAKGANMIIADILPTRATPERYRNLVHSAVAAHMNMIRVWGGGVYPPEDFYDLCDELGLMVWQEVMMACALYPRNDAFLHEIHEEVQFQMRRINWHPSVVIWGGNNEVETAMDGWFEQSKENPQLYVADYVKLFLDTVQQAVAKVDSDFPFVDSSPSNGLLSEDPCVKRWGDASGSFYGDVHYYNYNADSFDEDTYPHARFVSEFGFQSLPTWKLYQKVTQAQDWDWTSKMSEFRMRHPNGTLQLLDQAQRHFHITVNSSSNIQGHQAELPDPEVFRKWTYLTQLQQAITYETAIGLWRRLKGAPAHTMGVLYWQLNDVWLGASWSSMDFGGNWRLSHYSMKKVYAPLMLTVHHDKDTDKYSIWAVSDLNEEIQGNLTVELLRLDYTTGPVNVTEHCFSLKPLESKAIYTDEAELLLARLQILNRSREWQSQCVAHVTAVIDQSLYGFDDGGKRDHTGLGLLGGHQNNESELHTKHADCKSDGKAADCSYLICQIAHMTQRLLKTFSVNIHAASWCANLVHWGNCWCQPDDYSMSEQSAMISVDGEPSINLTEVMQKLAAPNRAFLTGLTEMPNAAVLDDLAAKPSRSESTILYAGLNKLQLVSEPNITAAEFILMSPYMIQFEIRISHVAPYIAVESSLPGRFSDNNFLLKPWRSKAIAFLSDQPLNSTKSFSNCLSFLSLTDTALVLS